MNSFKRVHAFQIELEIESVDMSRVDLVSKNLLANGFRNCRKRNN